MADEQKFIDAMPLIAEYDKSIQWLKDNVGMLSMNQFTGQMASMQSARKMLLDAPAADVRPLVRGRWLTHADKRRKFPYCSECSRDNVNKAQPSFCPNCGADMRDREAPPAAGKAR